MKLDTLIAEHMDAKSNLDKYKQIERDLRLQIIDELFPTAGEGTHTKIVGDLKVKATIKMNYKLDQEELDMVNDLLTPEEQNCIRRTPALDLAQYRKLLTSQKIMIDDCITVQPGLPALAIVVDESINPMEGME